MFGRKTIEETLEVVKQVEDYMREFVPPLLRQYRNQPEELTKQLSKLRAEGLETLPKPLEEKIRESGASL